MRIDQGVDFGGTGPVYALGPGVIENVNPSGWPGQSFIEEKLTQGPLKGLEVYAAENITPTVHVGQKVNKTTQIGTLQAGYPWSEFGIAHGPGGNTLAATLGENAAGQAAGDPGKYETAAGVAFARLLHELGAPMGAQGGLPVQGNYVLHFIVPPKAQTKPIGGRVAGNLPYNPSLLFPVVGQPGTRQPHGRAIPVTGPRGRAHRPAHATTGPYILTSDIMSARHGTPPRSHHAAVPLAGRARHVFGMA